LKVSNITISSSFFITGKTCVGTLAVGQSCYVNVSFKPTHWLLTTGMLGFSDSAANTPQTASLYGISLSLFQGSLSQ